MPAEELHAVTMTPVELYDAGFGPYMLSVAPPGAQISPSSSLTPKVLGKAPARLTGAGWTGTDLTDPKHRCHDYQTAKLWQDGWNANVGFAVGDGYIVIDNDEGELFTRLLREAFAPIVPLRRYVLHPKHFRDAHFLRVLDFVGDPVDLANQNFVFRKGVMEGKMQLLARNKQAVIAGLHPGTNKPYVWEKRIELSDIPVISKEKFEACIKNFMMLLAADGWTVPQAPAQAPTNMGGMGGMAGGGQNSAGNSPEPLDPVTASARFAEARSLLARIPNREVPLGEIPTKADLFLDSYDNWRDVAYMVAGFLGPYATFLGAEDVFVGWSDGRQQNPVSHSSTLWRNVVKGQVRRQSVALISLADELSPLPPPLFPDDQPKSITAKTINENWAFWAQRDGGFIHLNTGVILSHAAFGRQYADGAAALANELGWKKKGRKPNVADIFVEQPDKPIVTSVTYAPGEPRLVPDPLRKGDILNLWQEPQVVARHAHPVTAKEIKPWLDHVEFILETQAEADRFIRWCACVVQLPKEKPAWHWLILSCPGLGKDTMAAPLRVAVGEKNCKEIEIHQISGDFNDVCESKLWIVSETVQSKADARLFWNRFKPLLAKPPEMVRINRKHIEPYQIPNRGAAIMFSNDLVPIFLEQEDRRLHVLNQRHLVPQPKSYYTDLWKWLKAGGAEAVAVYLHTYPLLDADRLDFVGGTAPMTPDKIGLIQQNLDPALSALEDLIDDVRTGSGTGIAGCLATVGQLADEIENRTGRKFRPTNSQINAWLLDMERRDKGVGRLRKDPTKPGQCGPVASKGQGSQRLWHLSAKAPDGRHWGVFGGAELLALWQGKPIPTQKARPNFPDDEPI